MTNEKKTPVGGLVLGKGDIEINAGYPTTTLKVRNTGDRPIQVGSHFHFFGSIPRWNSTANRPSASA